MRCKKFSIKPRMNWVGQICRILLVLIIWDKPKGIKEGRRALPGTFWVRRKGLSSPSFHLCVLLHHGPGVLVHPYFGIHRGE